MNQHRVVIDERVIKTDAEVPSRDYQALYQLTHITKDRGALAHDDRLEAFAMGVNYWVESMARSQDSLISEHNDRLLQEELDRFAEGVFGMKAKDDLWVEV